MKQELKSKYEGSINFDDINIQVAILNNGKKVVYEKSLRDLFFDFRPNDKVIIFHTFTKKLGYRGYFLEDFFNIIDNLYSNDEKLNKIIFIIRNYEFSELINEVTGYNVSKKIEQKIKKEFKKEKPNLSEFDKKIKQALNFNPKENK